MFAFLRKLFKPRELFGFDTKAKTIPEAFGYSEADFNILVNELSAFIHPEDRLGSFNNFLLSPLFQRFHLDINNPKHAAIIGYAFCAAVIIQRNLQTQNAASNVLSAFYPSNQVSKEKN